MVVTQFEPSQHRLAEDIYRLEAGEALLVDSPTNLIEVVGILRSYGVVLDAYAENLKYVAEDQFLIFFNFFKYFNGEVNLQKLFRHWWHDRINYEYAEYTMRAMMWHGGGGLDSYLDTPEFREAAEKVIQAKFRLNPLMRGFHQVFNEFLPEHLRQMAYYKGLGEFWTIMSKIFLELSDRYLKGEIKSIPDVVDHIQQGLVNDANTPITYAVEIRGQTYDLIPKAAGLTFLPDTAVPYVESIFFRGTPFPGLVSFNAQAYQIPAEQEEFAYGALNADVVATGTSGVPPTLLMQDMRHFLPDYLQEFYQQSGREEGDLLVKICQSFQKSMFCVTTAAVKGLAPHPFDTTDVEKKRENRRYLEQWMDRMLNTRLQMTNQT
ncbi:CO2 hydration protein [Dactylococcopsis salina]|uniref:CO2 hydration protein n=1 Tax=Dactylococcopsis salina (strain PCC 8305) TaxID=13035 RepID=K9YXG8_DACS8|nr:CO2 hydration protein [Dactylococcopsis salina]AFZ51177.1 CO2 hydration protein [Dactylococcopsis salina PCC 8305]